MNLRQFFIANHWWGKLIGACIGYLLAGPAGALFGILLGNFFERAFYKYFTRPYFDYHLEKRQVIQQAFFDATFSVMGYFAKIDGAISQNAIVHAKQLMEDMRLSKSQKILAKKCFNAGKELGFDLVKMLRNLAQLCQSNADLLKLFLDIQYNALLIEDLSTKKLQAFDFVLQQLGFAPLRTQFRFYENFGVTQKSYYYHQDNFTQNKTVKSPLQEAYLLFELNPGANKQEVKKAYRRLISRHHPDKLIAEGLPEAMIKMANDKTQKIVKAYELIAAHKGWK